MRLLNGMHIASAAESGWGFTDLKELCSVLCCCIHMFKCAAAFQFVQRLHWPCVSDGAAKGDRCCHVSHARAGKRALAAQQYMHR